MKNTSALLHLAWFSALCYASWDAAGEWTRLNESLKKVESGAAAAVQDNRDIHTLLKQIDSQTAEMNSLQDLFKFIPQDKSYLRTQKAISDEVQGLRRQLSRKLGNSLHILVDTKTNQLYLKKGLSLMWQADCSVGRGGILTDARTGRRWEFVTPRGEFRVLKKIKNPVWTKPDWAFTESGEAIPPPGDASRKVEGELGAYVLNLGDGYLIHGTKNEDLLGTAVSHGCVRLGAENLEKLYQAASVGTRVFIY